MEAFAVPSSLKTTLQSLKKIPGVVGLYRHNGELLAEARRKGVKLGRPEGTTLDPRWQRSRCH
jgi:hypothetical protein